MKINRKLRSTLIFIVSMKVRVRRADSTCYYILKNIFVKKTEFQSNRRTNADLKRDEFYTHVVLNS